MNPQAEQSPGLHLPQPAMQAAQPSTSYQAGNFATQPLPTPTAGSVPTASSQQTTQPAQIAEDTEESLADAEWVSRARDIAQQYKHDPFIQSRELSKLKAQYMKVRYDKDIKVSEDRSS